MLILVSYGHLLNDLLDVLIGDLNCPIHLGPIRHAIMVLDFEILTHFLHHFVVQIGGIIGDDLLGNPYLQIISFLMNLTTTFLVTLAYNAASTHLVK